MLRKLNAGRGCGETPLELLLKEAVRRHAERHTYTDLSRATGIHRSHIYSWLAGEKGLGLDFAGRLAVAVGLTLAVVPTPAPAPTAGPGASVKAGKS